MNQSEEA